MGRTNPAAQARPEISGPFGDGYLELDASLTILRPLAWAGRRLAEVLPASAETALRQAHVSGAGTSLVLPAPSAAGPSDERVEWQVHANAAGGLSIFLRRLPDPQAGRLGLLAALDEGFLLGEIVGDPAAPPTDVRFIEANPAAIRLAGEDYTGRRLSDLNSALAPCWREIFRQAPAEGSGRRFEVLLAPLRIWLECYVVRLPIPGPRLVAALFRDVTERRRAAAALEDSGRRMAAIVAQAAVGLSEIALDGRFIEVNDELCRILGRDRPTVLALGVAEVTWPEDMTASRAALQQVIETGQPVAVDKRYRRPDGSAVWASSSLSRLDDEQGRPRAVLAVTADLTARRQNEAHLYESEARVRTLAEGIPQLVWRATRAGELDWVSPQWTAFTGLSLESSLGHGWLEAVHPEDREATLDAWVVAEAEGRFAVEHRIHVVTDGYRWCQSRAALRREDGAVEWLGTSTDIEDQVRLRHDLARARDEMETLVAARTSELANALEALRAEVQERERAEEALRHTQKLEAVGQLTGGIAHDFNNMLQGVTGGLDMARRRVEQGRGADAVRYLEAAQDAAQRAAALTRRLLAFARRQRLDPRLLDPAALIQGMGDLVRRTVGPSIALELELDPARGSSVLCDPSELEGALLNLCINARDAMPDGGRLAIGTTTRRFGRAELLHHAGAEPGEYVGLSVSDTGTGMRREVMERVFEPFFTTKPQGQGTGLGLSQVYGFVRQSGGLVRIESALGRGTTVRLWLPRHDTPAPPPAAEPRATPKRCATGEVVLLVDDEAAVRTPAAARLRELGYEVLEAQDAAAALRMVSARQRIDLLVTDVGLTGGMNGRQLAEVLQDQRPNLPVLFITGYAGSVLPQGVDVIGKPFALDALAQRVQAALARP
ncbi:PAS domain S-box protein [Falsiroseomonas sp. E2-1-a20]|uniref:PAS domain S-box protein n=1 Tax=Falsiroseomonas sp. E2-1-a20 TaxID=3239300 RepID=UPI003F38F325